MVEICGIPRYTTEPTGRRKDAASSSRSESAPGVHDERKTARNDLKRCLQSRATREFPALSQPVWAGPTRKQRENPAHPCRGADARRYTLLKDTTWQDQITASEQGGGDGSRVVMKGQGTHSV